MPEIQSRDAGELDSLFEKMTAALRKYLRDFTPLNRLLGGEESSDSDLQFAIINCVEDINGTPPVTNYTLQDLLNRRQAKLILDGAACEVVRSVMLYYGRNELRFTDAGVSIAVNDKAGFLLNWYQLTKTEYEQKKEKFKVSANMESIVGPSHVGIHSEYLNLFDFVFARK